MKQSWWIVAVVAVLGGALVAPLGRESLWHRFFHSLRIDRPQAVSVSVPGFSGPNASRLLPDMIAGMIADTATVVRPEDDQGVPDAAMAGRMAGFAVALPHARTDRATLTVLGGRDITLRVSRSQLATIFREAGRRGVMLAPSLEGAAVAVKTPRGIRAQYGRCPLPAPATIQGQIQGPPPASTDNGNCIVLTARPATSVAAPADLDMAQLTGIGLELSGMSPNQAQAFQHTFDWHLTLSLSLPRFLRSYDSVSVSGAPGVMFGMGFRRGPSYQLVWVRQGIVYSLVGYGSSADALPIASSVN